MIENENDFFFKKMCFERNYTLYSAIFDSQVEKCIFIEEKLKRRKININT